MSWSRGALCAALAGAALVVAGAARAQEAGPCDADAARLCADAADDAARIRCLNRNKAELSRECKKETQREWTRAFGEACEGDAKRLCGSMRGLGRIACLTKHQDDLSQGCRPYVEDLSRKP